MANNQTVAVIGLGPAGLATLKNMREAGFDAVAFERNDYIGGLWHYTPEAQTCVLKTTVVTTSKERGCFTDYPFAEDIRPHPVAAEVEDYLESYAKHFSLRSYMRLSTNIQHITFEEDRRQWKLEIESASPEYFDKIIIANGGIVTAPNYPQRPGIEKFTGVSVHSQGFKEPKEYQGKRVMVVGFGISAADTAVQLTGVADKVYLAHRHGARILARITDGRPVDHAQSMRLFTAQSLILRYFPKFGEQMFDKFIKSLQDKEYNLRPEWGFEPPQKVPIMCDRLVSCLGEGSIASVSGFKQVVGPSQVELEDGQILDVDAIIWCTGYKAQFDLLESKYDPCARSVPELDSSGTNKKPFSFFRLYHNVFSLDRPESLAFIGNVHFAIGGFQLFDLASMAVAQVWLGNSSLPSKPQMDAAVKQHCEWLHEQSKDGATVSTALVSGGPWMEAMDGLAGTGVNEYLGYGWKGWWFWLRNPTWCNMLMGGIWSPILHRVFDTGKRKAWDGARAEIERMNAEVAGDKRAAKKND